MKTNSDFTYARAITYGVLTELLLVLTQFIYLKYYANNNPEVGFVFTSDYMINRGFYVFQIIGFFVYTVVVFVLIRKIKVNTFKKILALIVTGAVIELTFYAIVPADYELAFFFSVLDKFIAGIFGAIVYFYSSDSE
ncbi:MAG: hypothetical protein KA713_01130 [Chryseotalea sp. WA131a]|nr:MAG: hypothetical protein KA713_01130 [Chryseotalea sp. WA131a]